MTVRNQIRRILTGLTIPQEYICAGGQNFQNQLLVFLALDNQKSLLNITASHLFLGYGPLIIGLPFNINDGNSGIARDQGQVPLSFVTQEQTEIARLVLKKIGERVVDNKKIVFFYEGEYGSHSFLIPLHQWISRQREKWRKHSASNVSLPGNLMEQVRIAYSIPRIISVITTSDGSLMNMFPTDLHGCVGEKVKVEPKCFLATQTRTGIDESTGTYSYTSDKLSALSFVYPKSPSSNGSTTVTFDSNGNLTKLDRTSSYTTFTYNGTNQLTRDDYFSKPNNVLTSYTNYEYNSSGQLVKVIYYGISNGVTTTYDYNTYEYASGSDKNPLRIKRFLTNNTLQSTKEYEYDSKKSPFKDLRTSTSFFNPPSQNNATKETRKDAVGTVK